MSTRTGTTSQTSKIMSTLSPWSNNKKMKELHKEFSKLNNGRSDPKKFTDKAKRLGYKPTEDLYKVLKDPAPKFKNVVKTFEKFQKPKTQERLPNGLGRHFPRYGRNKGTTKGISNHKKIAALQEFQRGNLTVDQLNKKLGKSSGLTGKDLDNINSGDFTKVASKVVRNGKIREEQCSGVKNIDPEMLKEAKNGARHRFGKKKIIEFLF